MIDENDNEPQFIPFDPLDPVPEDISLGSAVATIEVTDKDSSDDGFDAEIISGNPGRAFRMTQATKCSSSDNWCSDIIVNNELDYESNHHYQLTIRVTDKKDKNGRTNDKNTVIEIPIADVDDNPPVLPFGDECITDVVNSCPKIVTIDETGDVVSIFSGDVTDFDTKAENREFEINFQITDPILASKFTNIFSLTPIDLEMKFNLIFNGYFLSRDECNLEIPIKINVASRVNNDLASSGTILVRINDVNNNPPLIYYRSGSDPLEAKDGFIQKTLRIRNYAENSRTSRAIIELDYEDLDCAENGNVLWLIEEGFEYFELERTLGQPKNSVELLFLRKPDFEQKFSYSVVLKAYDNPVNTGAGFNKREVRVRIQIELLDEDDNEPFFWFPGIRTQVVLGR